MKFVTLALTLLLAIGSQAASLQADAPSQLQHVRAAVGVYLNQVKESAVRALDHLDDTEYRDFKGKLSQSLDNLQVQLQQAQAGAAPYTDAFVAQFMGATADVRASVMADVDMLRADLAPKREALKNVLNKHVEEYRVLLEPVIQEYAAKHRSEMEALKVKLDPLVEELSAKVAVNVEETKAALLPMVESVRSKLTERLELLKAMATPYVEEYKEQMTKVLADLKEKASTLNMEDVQSQLAPHFVSLREKATPLAEEIKAKLLVLYDALSATRN